MKPQTGTQNLLKPPNRQTIIDPRKRECNLLQVMYYFLFGGVYQWIRRTVLPGFCAFRTRNVYVLDLGYSPELINREASEHVTLLFFK